LILGLARAVAPGFKSHRTRDHILLSHLRLPQLEGPGPCIYIPQEQGGLVIPPGTGFPFHCLLWLAGGILEVEVYLWPTNSQSVSQSVLVSGSQLEPMTRFLFSVWRLQVSWNGAPSLMKGWVCNLLLQLLLGLARAVTLGSKSHRTHDEILLSHLRLPQLQGPGSHIYIPQEQSGPVIPPGTGFPYVTSYDSQGYGGGIINPPPLEWSLVSSCPFSFYF
jgi:hypothetical protein